MNTLKTIMSLALALLLTAVLASCVKKNPLAGDQRIFAGKWVAADGTFIVIYNDGGGDLKTSNSSITGGKTTFAGDTITIGLGPITKKMKITAKPKESGGKWVMVLDGFDYKKE